jgi:hypothetical protein
MPRGKRWVGLAVATVVALPLTGCASTLRLDMSRACQAHGGTWSQAQESCTMPGGASPATKQAKDICAYQGGTYLPGGSCVIEGRSRD